MASSPDDELTAAAGALAEHESLGRKLESARQQADASATEAARARARLADEQADSARLEKMSLTSILAHLKGSHDDDLAREAAEQQAAEYEYLTRQARADADRKLVDHLEQRRARLGDVQARFDRALADKERWMRQHNDPQAARLVEIAQQQGGTAAEIGELGQALDAGEAALEHLRAAAETLDDAGFWSAYDTWFDGGMIASMVKNDRLDEVAALLRAADSALRAFTAELSDVHMAGVRLVELGEFTKMFDVWFDNLFTDLAVRDRIIEAKEKVTEAITGVHRIQEGVASRIDEVTARLERLHADRVELLTT
ncbi:hypothetical protein [Mycolicibacterium arseniciresistens]|uniref:Uncharacterized protein n=1 Tax=Mycolicibacterium arseniciresistens TaxID=3062257 RepID=A0ABT8UKF9_9MYCO|nr:hypothetical protein [Mycolicibacterium arseniciresistens]MDO3638284.1 hypothetical protein [Mycolicibacterium arseniciresistens]